MMDSYSQVLASDNPDVLNDSAVLIASGSLADSAVQGNEVSEGASFRSPLAENVRPANPDVNERLSVLRDLNKKEPMSGMAFCFVILLVALSLLFRFIVFIILVYCFCSAF